MKKTNFLKEGNLAIEQENKLEITDINNNLKLETMTDKEFNKAKKQVVKSESMNTQIMERTDNGYQFKEEHKRFGLIKENRPIRKTEVVGFMQIISNNKYDDSQSIIAVEATDVIDRYDIVDLEGKPIKKKDAQHFLIVLDGQHRITAFAKLNAIKDADNKILIPNVHIKNDLKNIGEYLADINMTGHSWNTADKICVSAISTENPLMKKINTLIKEGFNASAAVMICTGKKLTPTQLKAMLSKGDTSILPEVEPALARADKFITTAQSVEGMSNKILTKRYFIKGFNSYAKATSDEKAFEALSKLNIDDFLNTHEDDEFIEKLKTAFDKAA